MTKEDMTILVTIGDTSRQLTQYLLGDMAPASRPGVLAVFDQVYDVIANNVGPVLSNITDEDEKDRRIIAILYEDLPADLRAKKLLA